MPTDRTNRLPAANEFTPGQLGGEKYLYTLLELVIDLHGAKDKVVEAIRTRWFSTAASARTDPAERAQQQTKRAANVVSGMRQYGLLTDATDPLALTSLGETLYNLRDNPDKGFEKFAAFLLRKRYGIELLEVAQSIRARDGSVTKTAVDQELKKRGFDVSNNSSYTGKLRQWLGAAGVVDYNWNVDESRFEYLAGFARTEIANWRALTPEQRSMVEILRIRAIGNATPIQSSDLLALLRQHGVEFNPGQVRKDFYKPLEASGWIKHDVASAGRGGKGGLVSPTKAALDLNIDLIKSLQLGDLPPELQDQLDKPLKDILVDLESTDTWTKGNALELLALRLASDVGLYGVDLRLRGIQTGGAEVDLVAEGAHLHFSRWLFQCKNQTATVGLPVLAKELGMATILRAQVVVIVTTSTFASSVREYARQAAETTSIQIVLLDKSSLNTYKAKGPAGLRSELHQYAAAALTQKRNQLAQAPRE